MSRVGKLPVAIPSQVNVGIADNQVVVKGSKGELKLSLTGDVQVSVDDGKVWVKPANDSTRSRAMWGTVRATLQNMVKGVSEGFTVRLEIRGVGYRAAVEKKILTMSLGFSHEIKYLIPDGITVAVDKQTVLAISGYDKQKVGQVAAEIIRLRKPEPYKGKGVRVEGQNVRTKEGKKK